jgi:hypothetical protein
MFLATSRSALRLQLHDPSVHLAAALQSSVPIFAESSGTPINLFLNVFLASRALKAASFMLRRAASITIDFQ